MPSTNELAEWTTTIDQALTGSSFDDVIRAMQGMIAGGLAFERDDGVTSLEQRADVYFLVLQNVPPDILSNAVGELLKTEKWFPPASRWLEVCDAPWGERQRMRRRIRELSGAKAAADEKRRHVAEPEHVKVAGIIASFQRWPSRYEGRIAHYQAALWDIAIRTRNLAINEGQPIPAWATGEEPIVLKFDDGEYRVFVEPPPENPKRPEPMPFGMREPVVKPAAETRTPAEQEAIDQAKAGRAALKQMADDYGDYPDSEPY